MRLTGIPYTVSWIDDLPGIDPLDDNVDVIVSFADGGRYTATFFTPQNVLSLMEKEFKGSESLKIPTPLPSERNKRD